MGTPRLSTSMLFKIKVENFYQFLSRARAWHGTRIPYSYPLSSSTKAAASVRSRISAVRFGSSWLLNIILISPLQQHAQMGDQHVDRLSLQNLASFPMGKWHDCVNSVDVEALS